MKKLIIILTILLLTINLSACITDVAKEEWKTITIGEISYDISCGIDAEYLVKENSKNKNCVDFYKNGDRVTGGEFIIDELPSERKLMIESSVLIEERRDDSTIYCLYEYSQYGATSYFAIAKIENKNSFFIFETNGNLAEIEPLFAVIKIE